MKQYDIQPITQSSSSNCVQTSTSQFLGYYGINVTPDEIEQSVPVRTSTEGKPMGTLFADIGSWIHQKYGKKTAMHVFDSQIIDRSWTKFSAKEIKNSIELLQQTGVKTAATPYADLHINAYNNYLSRGGSLIIEKCTNELLIGLLDKGPVLAIISFNYMYDYPRCAYDKKTKTYLPDPANGKAIEHAVLLTGYTDDSYFYNDPDYEFSGRHEVAKDVMIGAICTAQLNSDNYLLVISEK